MFNQIIYDAYLSHTKRNKGRSEVSKYLKGELKLHEYWTEFGAFIFTDNRQVGKTRTLAHIVNKHHRKYKNIYIAAPYKTQLSVLKNLLNSAPSAKVAESLESINPEDTLLVIDEVFYCQGLPGILCHNWKDVIGVGTHKFRSNNGS